MDIKEVIEELTNNYNIEFAVHIIESAKDMRFDMFDIYITMNLYNDIIDCMNKCYTTEIENSKDKLTSILFKYGEDVYIFNATTCEEYGDLAFSVYMVEINEWF